MCVCQLHKIKGIGHTTCSNLNRHPSLHTMLMVG